MGKTKTVERTGDESPSIRWYHRYKNTGVLYENRRELMFNLCDRNSSYNFFHKNIHSNCAPNKNV